MKTKRGGSCKQMIVDKTEKQVKNYKSKIEINEGELCPRKMHFNTRTEYCHIRVPGLDDKFYCVPEGIMNPQKRSNIFGGRTKKNRKRKSKISKKYYNKFK